MCTIDINRIAYCVVLTNSGKEFPQTHTKVQNMRKHLHISYYDIRNIEFYTLWFRIWVTIFCVAQITFRLSRWELKDFKMYLGCVCNVL